MERKKEARSIYREKRNALTEEQAHVWSKQICRRLFSTELFIKANVIYFYYPLGREVNLLSAAEEALKQGKIVGFPKTEGADIRFYHVTSLEAFAEGPFCVMEPLSLEVLEDRHPLILTPGLMFDNEKNRMGYGRGYYDRYIKRLPEAVKIGIAYEMQIGEAVPIDAYDIPMDYMITESRFW